MEELLAFQSQNLPILFLDTTNFNIHISRSEGQSQKATRCSTIAAASNSANVHVIGCINNLGLIYSEVKQRLYINNLTCDFVKKTLWVAKEKYSWSVILVIDNPPCHLKIKSALDEEFSNDQILRLGPYSSILNPIENVWSIFKAEVKRKLAENSQEILMRERLTMSIKVYRPQTPKNYINAALAQALCSNFIAGIQGKIMKTLNLEDIFC